MKKYDFILTERVKPRIDHPEDLVWQYGSSGFKNAVNALKYTQENEDSITLKWDGTPSLIFGRDPNTGKFTLTDKTGFGATTYKGRPDDAQELYNMLYSRLPNQPNRSEYAKKIAILWNYFEKITPPTLRGFYQGDLLYVGTPTVENNNYVIKPNKITYSIPVNSKFGKAISLSVIGIAVHSFFKNYGISVPEPVNDVSDLQTTNEVLVIPPRISTLKVFDVSSPKISNIDLIDSLLDQVVLKSKKISDFNTYIGKYVNHMARMGDNNYENAPTEFIKWFETYKNVSETKRNKIKLHIKENVDAYNKLWEAISKINEMKTLIKKQLDNQENNIIKASISGKNNHEGYVVSTPYGKIKLVDRYIFMRKD